MLARQHKLIYFWTLLKIYYLIYLFETLSTKNGKGHLLNLPSALSLIKLRGLSNNRMPWTVKEIVIYKNIYSRITKNNIHACIGRLASQHTKCWLDANCLTCTYVHYMYNTWTQCIHTYPILPCSWMSLIHHWQDIHYTNNEIFIFYISETVHFQTLI